MKIMKKAVVFLLALAITVASFVGIGLTVAAETDGIYTYSVTNGNATLTKCDSSAAGSLTVPATLGGYPVTAIGPSAFKDCEKLTKITLPNGMISIGSSAFRSCTELTSINIVDGITSIGSSAFRGCERLTGITVPNSVLSIGSNAFSNCVSLTSIVVKAGNPTYHSSGNCLIETESKTLMYGCVNSVIPDDGSVTVVGNGAFKLCYGLKSINIPSGISAIGDSAFSSCRNLKEINFAASITEIAPNAFYDCGSLETIQMEEGNPVYQSKGNCLIETQYKTLILGCKTSEIPTDGSVTCIGDNAFYKCDGLVELSIPEGVQQIGLQAFFGCTALSMIVIPKSMTYIGVSAFAECKNLKNVAYVGNSDEWSSVEVESNGNDFFLNADFAYDIFFYEVFFDGNRATAGITESFTATYNLKRNLPANGFFRIGYNFAGWNTKPDGSGKKYADKASVINLTTVKGKNVTLYAMWNTINYKINYQLAGGSNNTANPATYNIETGDITISDPVKPGYLFGGWFVDAGFKNYLIKIAAGSVGDVTLYAKWDIVNYTISYKLNGGTLTIANPSVYNVTTSDITLKNPTKLGYVFDGWYTDTSYKTKVTKINKGSVGNKNLYAKWSKRNFKITYQLDGGKNNPSNPATFTIDSPDITFKNPTKAGYTFAGWYSDAGFKDKVIKIVKGSSADATVYAKWNIITYTVTYQPNGGKNPTGNPKTYTVNTAAITLKNPTRVGYTFGGWYSDSALKTKVTKIAKGSTGNKTLYAKWTKNTYTITYKLDGGKNNAGNPKTYTVTTATITLKNPTKTGYTFAGWYSDAKFKNKISKIVKGSAANATVYAKWNKNTYTITYKLDGGKNNAGNPKTYTVTTAAITLKTPTRTGYTFVGWYSDAKYKTKVTKIAKGSTGNKTLYAKWKKK